jgi:hypothetical protein
VKLSDDEPRALQDLERSLWAKDPRLHARLRDMTPGRLTALRTSGACLINGGGFSARSDYSDLP